MSDNNAGNTIRNLGFWHYAAWYISVVSLPGGAIAGAQASTPPVGQFNTSFIRGE